MAAHEPSNSDSHKPLIVLSAPSGAGKTSIAHSMLSRHPQHMIFSISATTRQHRVGEHDGVDYYFLDKARFQNLIDNNGFVEYEEIFGNLYGTPLSEIARAESMGKRMLFDMDVKGGLSIRRKFPDKSLLIFIAPPSIEILRERLERRGTETPEIIARRLERAEMEMSMMEQYDHIVVNSDLGQAIEDVEKIIFGEHVRQA